MPYSPGSRMQEMCSFLGLSPERRHRRLQEGGRNRNEAASRPCETRRETLRAPNIMKHTLRCHGFGDAGPAARSGPATGMRLAGSRGPKPCQPKGVAARIADAPERGAGTRLRDATVQARVRTAHPALYCPAPGSHPSMERLEPAPPCAGRFVARLANTASIGCASLRAIDDSGSQRTRVSLC